MINVEILLKGLGYLELDSNLTNEFGIQLVFNVDDLKDISGRKSNYSKTIKVLGTDINNKLFTFAFDIQSDGTFDITLKQDCILFINRNPIIVGYISLKQIEKNYIGGTYQIIYSINIFDEIINFFDDLGEKKLIDLNFESGFTFQGITYPVGDHIFNYTNVINSIYSGISFQNIYEYPLVNYNYNLIGGKKWPYQSVGLSELRPSIYYRTIIDKIFYDAGYTYISEFLDGTTHDGLFDRILNIYNGTQLMTNVNCCLFMTGPVTIIEPNYIKDLTKNDYYLGGSVYDFYHYELDENFFYSGGTGTGTFPATSCIRVPLDGIYTVKFYIDIETSPHTGTELTFYKYSVDDYNTSGMIAPEEWQITLYGTGGTYEFSGLTLVKDDLLDFFIRSSTNPFVCKNMAMELIYVPDSENFVDKRDTTLQLNEFLPDMKQSDFIRSLISEFNLYIWPDKLDEKILHVEPRDDFYKQGSTIDWTNKVDYSKSFLIENLNDLLKKKITFKNQEGDDLYNTQYKDKYSIVYGEKDIEINNNLIKDESIIETEYQSIQFYFHGYVAPWFNKIIPVLIPDLEVNYYSEMTEKLPMIGLIYSEDYDYTYWKLIGDHNAPMTTVKYITHVDTLGGNVYDLNFYTQHQLDESSIYNLLIDYNDRNCYNEFWKNYVENITNKNSRKLTCYINLNLKDILQMDFRNTIFIDGQFYYLQEINYDPSRQESSKCIFIKIVEPVELGSFDPSFLLINDLGDYILIDNGNGKIKIT